MKIHLPLVLRALLLACYTYSLQAELVWNSGTWNGSDASWLENGMPAVFSNGDSVIFTSAGTDKLVNITEVVEPAAVTVSGMDYVFSGSGGIAGEATLTISSGASLSIENTNTFTGGTLVGDSAQLTLSTYNGVGSENPGELAIGNINGAGTVIVSLQAADTMASIQGASLESFTGILYIAQGNVGLGRKVNHSGAGSQAVLGAARVAVGQTGSFIVTLGGGQAALETGNTLTPDVWTEDGASIGNRDGHVNWLGDIYLNTQDVTAETPIYDDSATTNMEMFYGKYVVWNGVVSGTGTLAISSGSPDSGSDHRLVLANGTNSFTGVYRVDGAYLTTLGLAAPNAALQASVELTTAQSRLVLMSTSAEILSLNGTTGVVQAEGNGDFVLTVGSGEFSGTIRDAGAATAGLSLGMVKIGSGNLLLDGTQCSYTGKTEVQGGTLQFSGNTTLSNVSVPDSSANIQITGDVSLRENAVLSFNLDGAAGSLLEAAGSCSLIGPVCAVQLSGYENLPLGSYEVMSWGAASSVSTQQFISGGLSDTVDYAYSLQVQGNSLKLVVGNMADTPWLWAGGSATWADDSAAQWSNATAAGPAGQAVTFSARNAGTITINRVTPTEITVNSGEYTFAAATADSAGIVSSGTLRITGNDTVLKLNLNNTEFSGATELNGGILVLGAEDALGSSALNFNGGLLRYGAGILQDVSAQLNPAALGQIRVDTNGNNVVWAHADGVGVALNKGIEKSGDGELSVNWTANGETRTGALQVQDGTLSINKISGNGTLSGSITGTGTLALTSPSGQMTVSGNNSDFAGTLLLLGDGNPSTGSVSFTSGASIGGADTLVRVAGQRFWFSTSTSTAANFEIMEGTTYFDGSTNRAYSFTGTISGSGTLIVKPSSNITMSGDVSSFTGSFEHPGAASVSWLFGGEGIEGSGLLQANLSSPGNQVTYILMYSNPTVMSGVVGGAAMLRQQGSGVVSLTGQNETSGALIIDAGCEVRLGTETDAGSWAGVIQSGSGQLTLVNGYLSNPLETMEGSLVADVAAGGVVNMGGMAGSALQSIAVASGGLLSGMTGNLNIGGAEGIASLYLQLGIDNIGSTAVPASGQRYMLELDAGVISIADAATVELDLESIKEILSGQRTALYLHLSNADIELGEGMTAADLFANSATTPESLGLVVLGIEGGNIVLEGAPRDVYMVTADGDYDTVTSYSRLEAYKATFVDSGYTLSLLLPGDNTQQAWVNNLLGGGNFYVENTDEASGVVRVLLNNEVLVSVDDVLTPAQAAQINTANTEIQGNVTAGHAVQLVKTGSGVLTVGGALSADWLEVEEGTLRLKGQGNMVNTLHGSGNLLMDGSLHVVGNATAFQGELSGDGTLIVSGVMNAAGSIGALQGDGQLQAVGESMVVRNLSDSDFSGTLADGDASGQLLVMSGPGLFTMDRVQGSSNWTVSNNGSMVVNLSGSDGNAVLTLGSMELLPGSDTSFIFDTDTNTLMLNLENFSVADAAAVTLISTGTLPLALGADGTLVLGYVNNAELGEDGVVPLTLGGGTPFRGIESAWLTVENGKLIFNTWRDERNQYELVAESFNAKTGAAMLWNLPKDLLTEAPDLKKLTIALDAAVAASDTAAANNLLAAAAGAGTAALGPATMGDLERQLMMLRNRTTSMGLNPELEYPDLPLLNAWVNAEGDRRELKASGSDAGYTLSGWGGTLGADLDFSDSFTAGLAITGMYGDFQSKSPDSFHGNADYYYVSLFGRYASNRWTHTVVGVIGWSEISLSCRVHIPGGGYQTKGDTDGYSLGLLYEFGYVIPLDEDNQSCLQPIANVSYRHVSLSSYAERGSDAALDVGEQSLNTVDFGLGVRIQTYALENLLNRKSLFEARLLVKGFAGDNRGENSVALRAYPSRSGRVRSAETGRAGLEAGAGFALPVGADTGFMFMDGSFDFRAEETELNATLGYRMTF